MEFLALGNTGLLVSRTGFGAMSLDCPQIQSLGENAEQQVFALVRKAYIAGMNILADDPNGFNAKLETILKNVRIMDINGKDIMRRDLLPELKY